MNEPPKNEIIGFEERNSVSGSKPESPQCRTKQPVTGYIVMRVRERTLSRYL